MENNENRDVVVMCMNNNNKMKLRDYISLGFGAYIGWNLARTLKYYLLLKSTKKKD